MVSSANDTRNLVDDLKGKSNEEVFQELSERRNKLEIAIENVGHDFNIGTIVRNANNFNAQRVYIIGKKKYNRRGAMCTDKYIEVVHCKDVGEFLERVGTNVELVAIENNVKGAQGLSNKKFRQETVLIFGSEGDGISDELLEKCDDIREIESFGSTRSVNVGVASGIAMYEWAKQCILRRGLEGEK